MGRARLIVAAFFWLAAAGAALAHASLVASDPVDGAVTKDVPARVTLTFDEPVAPLVVRLIGTEGTATPLDRIERDGAALRIALPPNTRQGTYALSWRVVSEDGHPVGGSILFSIGAPSAGALPDASTVIDWPLRVAIWTTRTLLYAGLFLGAGGILFGAFVAPLPRGAIRLQMALVVGGLAALPVAVGLQGADALGVPSASFAKAVVWSTGFETSFGRTAIVAAFALLAALLGLGLRPSPAVKPLSLAVTGAIGLALAASGHASTAAPQWLMRPTVFVHAAAVTAWLGAFIPLGLVLREQRADAVAALRRFSAIIPFALTALVLSGAILAIVQVGRPAAMVATGYGRVLVVKLALVAVLLFVAAINRWRLTPSVGAGDTRAIRSLIFAIVVESVVAITILGVVSVWRFTPPPRALEAAAAVPALLHIHTLPAMADLTVTPGHVGRVRASIVIFTGDFGPLDAKEVSLVLANPAAGVEPIRRQANRPGDGTWRVDDLTIPVAGRWQAEIVILISDFNEVRLNGEIDIRP